MAHFGQLVDQLRAEARVADGKREGAAADDCASWRTKPPAR